MSEYDDHYDLDSYQPPSMARSTMTTKSSFDDDTYTRTTATMSVQQSQSRTSASSARSPPSSRRHGQHSHHTTSEIVPSPNLTWRLDPDESLSDWTIIVLSADGQSPRRINDDSDSVGNGSIGDIDEDSYDSSSEVKYYHVHKTQLGVGPRRSEYFARLFRSRRQSKSFEADEEDENVSRIELKPTAAAAFPAMLDFIYSPPGTPVNATTTNAVALRHLATCFGIRELFTEVTTFIQQDLNVSTALTYLNEASTYSHEKLMTAAIKLCAVNFASIKLSRLVQLPPVLFQRIVCSPHFQCDSETLSSRVASYCRCRPGSIDRSFLLAMAPKDKMPRVAKDEALFLISVLVQLGMATDRGSTLDNEDGDDADSRDEPSKQTSEEPPTLYQRCLEAATDAVRLAVDHTQSNGPTYSPRNGASRRKTVDADYIGLPQGVKIDLLQRALLASPRADVNTRSNDSTTVNNSNAGGKDRHQDKEEYQRLKRAYEKKLSGYHTKLREKEDEVKRYVEEIGKFKRVPNEYRNPPLLSEHTFKEEPEYDRYGESLYGFHPPMALPRVGRPKSDGWIYRDERWHDDTKDVRYWPMYYYKPN